MPNLNFLPDQRVVQTSPGETILGAALRSKVPIMHACGGNALCSTCRVFVVEGGEGLAGRTGKEIRIADRLAFSPDFRLACQSVVTGDVTVRRLVLDDEDRKLADLRSAPARTAAPAAGRRRFGFRRRSAPRPIGLEQRVAVLFADIRGFTPFAEALLPYDVIHELERHLDATTAIVNEYGGQVTCYAGDGVMALFGLGQPEFASADAVRAALTIVAAAESRKPVLEDLYQRSFDVNVGVHVGDAIVGAMCGGVTPLTAVGDVVNIASRVEAANKLEGTKVLATAEVRADLGDKARTGKTIRCHLPGKAGEYELHEIVGLNH